LRQDEGFLRAIADSPHDDAHRLVYADWLEEHGQPDRAELIRVQVALADPPEDRAAYRTLRAREAALLDAHGQEWFGPLQKLGVHSWVLRRGLVEAVTLSARKLLEHAEDLFTLAPIHTVKLRDVHHVIHKLAACPLLRRLRGLDLSDNQLGAAQVRALLTPHLSGLRHLVLSDNLLGASGVRALALSPHLRGLRRLALRGALVSYPPRKGEEVWSDPDRRLEGGEGAMALAGQLEQPLEYSESVNLAGLVALDLRNNEISDVGTCALIHSPHLAGLTELCLSPMDVKDGSRLRESDTLRNLTVLRLSGEDLEDGIRSLLHSQFITRLRVLELSYTGARDEQAEEIADCRDLGELQYLNLADNDISDEGLHALASRGRIPRLRWLNLSKNRITSAGLRALCDSPLVKEMRELDLSHNEIDNSGAKALAQCPHLARLSGLALQGNSIKDAGAMALANSPLLAQLEGLSLNSNPIQSKGTVALVRAAHEAGMPQRGGNDFWVDPQRSRREPFRDTEADG
jgi:uncharacterized protein (TIGR02996 family)